MSMEFEKAFLMSGKDYKLTPQITLRHPSVDDILQLNHGYNSTQFYWEYVYTLLSDPYLNMVFLDDLGKDFMKTSPFEVFMLQWDRLQQSYLDNREKYDLIHINPMDSILAALNFFIVEDHTFVKAQYENGSYCLVDTDNTNCRINEEVYGYIYAWIKAINKMDFTDRIRPADENARRILIEDTRDEIKKQARKKKNTLEDTDRIGTIMSAVAFGGNGVITPFNLKDCKIYWLFEAFSIETRKSRASHLMDGIYHGTISVKDINKKELDWTS